MKFHCACVVSDLTKIVYLILIDYEKAFDDVPKMGNTETINIERGVRESCILYPLFLNPEIFARALD